MNDYLFFKKMISPLIIQGLFWILVAAVAIFGLITLFGGSVLTGLLILIFGPVLIRIYCELLIVLFQINNTLIDIKELKSKL